MTECLSSHYRQEYGRQAGFIRVPAILLSFPEKRLFVANLGYFFQSV